MEWNELTMYTYSTCTLHYSNYCFQVTEQLRAITAHIRGYICQIYD